MGEGGGGVGEEVVGGEVVGVEWVYVVVIVFKGGCLNFFGGGYGMIGMRNGWNVSGGVFIWWWVWEEVLWYFGLCSWVFYFRKRIVIGVWFVGVEYEICC